MEKHNSCINSLSIIQYFERTKPEGLDGLFKDLGPEMSGVPDPKAFLSDPNNWISSDLLVKLYERSRKELRDEDAAHKIGFNSVREQHLGYIQQIVLRTFGNPLTAIKHVQKVNDHFNKTKSVQLIRHDDVSATVRLNWFRDLALSRDFCLMNKGVYEAIPLTFGLPPAILRENKCFFKGDEYCEYDLHWARKIGVMGMLKKVVMPWKVARASLEELERDKELLREKYSQLHYLNQTLQEKINQLLSIQKSSAAILATRNQGDLLGLILNSLMSVARLERAGIFLAEKQKNKLTFIQVAGVEQEIVSDLVGYEVPMEKMDNIVARVAREKKPIFVEDVRKANLNPDNPLLKKFNPKSFILIPLTTRNEVVGVLVGDRGGNGKYLEELDKDYMMSFANLIAIAIENTDLYARLQASERKYREIVENANEAIFVLSSEGMILFANRRATELLGRQILQGLNFYSLVREESKKVFLNIIMENLSGRVAKEEIELEGSEKETVSVMFSSVPVVHDGIFDGCLIMATDLTEKKRIENILLRSQKLEAVGTLASGIAHDFNNIITGIIGYSQLMMARLDDRPELRNYAEIIEKTGISASEVVKQLLTFSRGDEAKEWHPSDINTIVRETVTILKSSLPRNIKLHCSLAENLPTLKCCSTQVQQALLNVLINARDAMSTGGTMTITTSMREDALPIPAALTDVRSGPYLGIHVEDTGEGITPEHMGKIFDPFFTTKAPGAGTGLGLAMVYGIVKKHGGHIEVNSTPGHGTAFDFFFPLGDADDDEKKEESPEEGEPLPVVGTLLVVNDEEVVRDLIAEIISPAEFSILAAKNRVEAFHALMANGDHIGVLFLDALLPGGLEVYRKAVEINPGIKTVIYSDENIPSEFMSLIEDNKVTLIMKPFQPDLLVDRIKSFST